MSRWRLDWPTSGGGRVARAVLKSTPEDFRVDEALELPGMEPDVTGTDPIPGGGEHVCLKLQKTGDNTEYVARELAKIAGSRNFDVGFCGLKDRHAVTCQWFSLYRPGEEDADQALIRAVGARWPVLAGCRQARKLRRGDHRGNQFQITLRGVAGSRDRIDQALGRLAEFGAPNYFGPQRFGKAGTNLDRAVAMDPAAMNRGAGSGGKRRSRAKRGGSEDSKNVLYFSAARSWLFNEVLAARVADGSWRQEDATGPLWGDGGTTAIGATGALERAVVTRTPELEAVFSSTRMKPERRPLALKPEQLTWRWLTEDSLELAFFLAPGQYATTMLGDIFELEDASLSRHNEEQG